MTEICNLSFIKSEASPSSLKLKKRKDGGFRQHPSYFFQRHCLGKFTSYCSQDIAHTLNIDEKSLEMFMASALSIDERLARKLAEATNIGAATWLELQRQYDCYLNNKATR